ncbi:GNAT family N-acetyltransferase [Streptococcus sp. ZY19097]|uniref:GNAT family N-acetyltransferase n=1 Tax=Streptococcus sp. ZY19097 TaxID=3231906 RepID=UPI003458CE38
MIIRQPKIDDSVQLYQLYQAEGWKSFTPDKIEQLLQTSCWFVLEVEGEICGFVWYLTDGVLTTYLCELLVSKKHRHKGYASLLLTELGHHHPKTRLDLVSEADDFYEHLQFRIIGTGMRKLISTDLSQK